MKEREFLLEAASFFLCDGGDLSIEEQLLLLEKVTEEGSNIQPPEDVLVWEPFEYWMADNIIEEIYSLAGLLERMYNLGKDGRKTS
jgi:hypothetical protein